MGYTIRIGEAEVCSSWPEPGDDEPFAHWFAKEATAADAPLTDDLTQRSNERWPSYGVWAEFCRNLGLYDWMFDEEIGKMRSHPGCFALTKADVEVVSRAVAEYRRRHPRAEPSFCPCVDCAMPWHKGEADSPPHNPNADGSLARAVWLEWWVRWAVENCEHPCISNS